jgi:uncharacterized protein YkwD
MNRTRPLPEALRSTRASVLAMTLGVAVVLAAAVVRPGDARASVAQKSAIAKQYANSMLASMNEQRAAQRLRPLTMNWRLLWSAYNHDNRQARQNRLSHQLPGEPYFATRISNTGYRWSAVAENIAWTSSRTLGGVLAVQRAMYDEQAPNNAHRLNILNPRLMSVGIDVYFDNTHSKLWLTQDFGRPS